MLVSDRITLTHTETHTHTHTETHTHTDPDTVTIIVIVSLPFFQMMRSCKDLIDQDMIIGTGTTNNKEQTNDLTN